MKHPYQVRGTTLPVLLGRKKLLRQLERYLLKPSPAHVSVVGPRSYGKSVLLHHVAKTIGDKEHYLATFYVDFRHSPPNTDADFRFRFGEALKKAITPFDAELAGYIELDDSALHELLDLVVQELEKKSQRLLAVLDGFDHVREGTGLTRNLLDQLRALAQHTSLYLVTGSRRTLRDLCENEESRVSDFHEIFEQPIFVGPFDEPDWDDVLEPFSAGGVTVEGSARKEIANWTGGIPLLVAALLQSLADATVEGKSCTKADVDAAAQRILDEGRELVTDLWGDCDVELRSDIAILAKKEREGILLSEISDKHQRDLEGRGFGTPSGNRMRSSCRMMAQYALKQAPAVAQLKRLFGTRQDFDSNIRSMLELRCGQVVDRETDTDLRNYIESAVRDLEPNPELALKWVRSIANRVLVLIWNAELDADQKLPEEWIEEWKQAGERLQWLDDNHRLPRRHGAQCGVLRLATGSERIHPKAKFVTKPTALLVDALQSVGDFGQHREDFPESTVSIGFAAAVVLAAIELVESLKSNFSRGEEA